MARRVAGDLRERIAHLEAELEILDENTREEHDELLDFIEATEELLRVAGVQDFRVEPNADSVRAVIKALKDRR